MHDFLSRLKTASSMEEEKEFQKRRVDEKIKGRANKIRET